MRIKDENNFIAIEPTTRRCPRIEINKTFCFKEATIFDDDSCFSLNLEELIHFRDGINKAIEILEEL